MVLILLAVTCLHRMVVSICWRGRGLLNVTNVGVIFEQMGGEAVVVAVDVAPFLETYQCRVLTKG